MSPDTQSILRILDLPLPVYHTYNYSENLDICYIKFFPQNIAIQFYHFIFLELMYSKFIKLFCELLISTYNNMKVIRAGTGSKTLHFTMRYVSHITDEALTQHFVFRAFPPFFVLLVRSISKPNRSLDTPAYLK